LYRDRDKALAHRDGKYCAIPGGPPGQLHTHNRDNQPDGLRRVTQTPSTAVPLAFIDSYLQDSIRIDFNLFKERDNIFFTEIN
jgi:hypothetical protein